MGVNVNVRAADLPETDRMPATSLLVETGETVDRMALLHEIVDRLQAAYREFEALGFRPLLDRWAAVDGLAGLEVELDLGGGAIRTGTVRRRRRVGPAGGARRRERRGRGVRLGRGRARPRRLRRDVPTPAATGL